MAEYIDRHALKNDGHVCWHDGKGNVFYEVDHAPIADVVEVVHGEWVLKSEIHKMLDDVDEEFFVECPFCKRTFYVPFEFEEEKMLAYAKKKYPYCNCGAKMDGKVLPHKFLGKSQDGDCGVEILDRKDGEGK